MAATRSAHASAGVAEREREREAVIDLMAEREAAAERLEAQHETQVRAWRCTVCRGDLMRKREAAERCRAQGHALKVVVAKAYTFRCRKCKRRTQLLNQPIPRASCACGSNSWEQAGQYRGSLVKALPIAGLSTHGGPEIKSLRYS